jgi:hypothetical protein
MIPTTNANTTHPTKTLAVVAIANTGLVLRLGVDEGGASVGVGRDDEAGLKAVLINAVGAGPDPGTAGNVETVENCVWEDCEVDAVNPALTSF